MVITNWQPFNFLCKSYIRRFISEFRLHFYVFWRYQWSTKPLWFQSQFVHYSLESFNNIFIRIKIKYSWKAFHLGYKYLLEKYIIFITQFNSIYEYIFIVIYNLSMIKYYNFTIIFQVQAIHHDCMTLSNSSIL